MADTELSVASEALTEETKRPARTPKSYARRNRTAIVLLLMIGVGAAGWYVWTSRGKPSRVIELPESAAFVGIADGKPLFRTSAGKPTLYTVDPASDRKHAIVRGSEEQPAGGLQALGAVGQEPVKPKEDPELAGAKVPIVQGRVLTVSVHDGDLIVATMKSVDRANRAPNPPAPRTMLLEADPATAGGGAASAAPLPVGRPGGREARVLERSDLGSARAVEKTGSINILRVPAGGGEPIPIAEGLGTLKYAVAGKTIYWVRDFEWVDVPPSLAPVRGSTPHRLPPCDELMSASLDGGPARKVGIPLDDGVRLIAGTDGIFWLAPNSAAPERTDTLCYLRNGESAPSRMPGFSSTMDTARSVISQNMPTMPAGVSLLGSPVDIKDRVYWLTEMAPPAGQPGGSSNTTQIVLKSAPAGLTTTTDLVQMDLNAAQLPGTAAGLTVHNGRLYAILWDGTKEAGVRPPRDPQDVSPESRPRLSLFQLDSAPKARLRRIATLPMDAQNIKFEGDHCYFSMLENKENWFDWSSQGLQTQVKPALYRIRLPH